MTFDLFEQDRVLREEFDPYDSRYEDFFDRYCDEVLDAFKASPEAVSLQGPDRNAGGWAFHFTRYVLNRLGLGLSEVRRSELEEIVGVEFPRHVSITDAANADTIIPELEAFWMFLKREYALPQADSLIRLLTRYQPGYRERMLDPANFGPAKGFVMAGQAAGFDMTDEAQMQQFKVAYNAGLTAERIAPAPFGILSDRDTIGSDSVGSNGVGSKQTNAYRKKKRKLAKAGRKASRRKR